MNSWEQVLCQHDPPVIRQCLLTLLGLLSRSHDSLDDIDSSVLLPRFVNVVSIHVSALFSDPHTEWLCHLHISFPDNLNYYRVFASTIDEVFPP